MVIPTRKPIKLYKTGTSGFTLVEILVVLVIVSLISVILMEGIAFVFNLKSRLHRQLSSLEYDQVKESWFRNTVSALKPLKEDDELVFKGDEKEFIGESYYSLNQNIGIPAKVHWRLSATSSGTVLQYIDSSDKVWDIKTFEGDTYFNYLNKNNKFVNRWSITRSSESNQLPEGILLYSPDTQTMHTWFVKIESSKQALIDIRKADS